MAQLAHRAATYADLEAVPPHLVAELLYGRLVTHPRPAPRHSVAVTRLGAVLAPPFDLGVGGPSGWVFMMEPELHLGEHVTVPDLAGWRHARLPRLPDTAWMETAPDWVCEVMSPSTERYNRSDKRKIYGESGVGHLWHVDTRFKLLEVFELTDTRWLLTEVFQEGARVRARPFEALEFELDLLWPFDTPESSAY
jgi:Uma2 family endonuclease